MNRKIIICKRCGEKKYNFGKNMCSACLRRTKRETNPTFYLGTCFSEMTRRIKTYDKKRPNYFNLEICSRDEFKSYFIKDPNFLQLFKSWQNSGYKRVSSPTIDRIDNKKGYTLDNIRFISHYENSVKDKRNKCYIKNIITNQELEFKSQKDLAKYLNVSPSIICRLLKKKKIEYKGFHIWK